MRCIFEINALVELRNNEDLLFQHLVAFKGDLPDMFVPFLAESVFVRLRENLENLEKGTFLRKIRENLENSGNFPTIFTTSGKTQGILFCQISLIK